MFVICVKLQGQYIDSMVTSQNDLWPETVRNDYYCLNTFTVVPSTFESHAAVRNWLMERQALLSPLLFYFSHVLVSNLLTYTNTCGVI